MAAAEPPSGVKSKAELAPAELEFLGETFSLREDEKILFHHTIANTGGKSGEDPHNCVCISNLRMFKLENKKYWSITRSDVSNCTHEEGGVLHWDKVKVQLLDGGFETFGIYSKKVCAFFVKMLQGDAKANKLKRETDEKEAKRADAEAKAAEVAQAKKLQEEAEAKAKADAAAGKEDVAAAEVAKAAAKYLEEEKKKKDKEEKEKIAAVIAEVDKCCKVMTPEWKQIWTSGSSGDFVAFWQPTPYEGWGTLGSLVHDLDENAQQRNLRAVCVRGEYFPAPRGFALVWSNKGRGFSFAKDVSVWTPIPPSAEYTAVGHVAVRGFDPPDEKLSGHVRCVHKRWVEANPEMFKKLWDSHKTGWKQLGVAFRSPHNTLIMQNAQDMNPGDARFFPHLSKVTFR